MSEQTQADNKNANDININKDSPELKKHSFEAEVAQLLHLVTHSLYSNADIFVRELVSNASDACDKLRFEATNDDSLYEDDGELKIRIAVDEDAKTITFIDNGIGMNEADAIENLGTIAKSGTKAFLDKLSESQKQDGQLIGQFGGIREKLGMSSARYYQLLGRLIETEAALEFDPLLVRRLRRIRDSRATQRASRMRGFVG